MELEHLYDFNDVVPDVSRTVIDSELTVAHHEEVEEVVDERLKEVGGILDDLKEIGASLVRDEDFEVLGETYDCVYRRPHIVRNRSRYHFVEVFFKLQLLHFEEGCHFIEKDYLGFLALELQGLLPNAYHLS